MFNLELNLVLTSVEPIQFLMLKLEIITFLPLQRKEGFGSLNKAEVVWIKRKVFLMAKK